MKYVITIFEAMILQAEAKEAVVKSNQYKFKHAKHFNTTAAKAYARKI